MGVSTITVMVNQINVLLRFCVRINGGLIMTQKFVVRKIFVENTCTMDYKCLEQV